MKAYEIMNDIIGEEFLAEHPNTVDTIKAGDENREVKRIGTCLTATPDVLRAAKEWGADLLITHEPTFYDHLDNHNDSNLTKMKEKLVEDFGGAIYRYHDSIHARTTDKISEGFIRKLGLEGDFDGDMALTLKEGITPVELARLISEKMGLRHPRIVGARDGKITKVNLCLGARGSSPYVALRDDDFEVAVAGELCEWYDCEAIRDLAQMGYQKTILVLGHAGSERDGMEYLAEEIDGKYDGAEARYFDCGEIFSYAD